MACLSHLSSGCPGHLLPPLLTFWHQQLGDMPETRRQSKPHCALGLGRSCLGNALRIPRGCRTPILSPQPHGTAGEDSAPLWQDISSSWSHPAGYPNPHPGPPLSSVQTLGKHLSTVGAGGHHGCWGRNSAGAVVCLVRVQCTMVWAPVCHLGVSPAQSASIWWLCWPQDWLLSARPTSGDWANGAL